MDRQSILEIVRRFRNALVHHGVNPSRIILYGSQARGNAREDSDIDLLVVSGDFRGRGHWERVCALSDAIYDIWEPIEAVAMTPEEWENGDSLIAQFAREGQVVYPA